MGKVKIYKDFFPFSPVAFQDVWYEVLGKAPSPDPATQKVVLFRDIILDRIIAVDYSTSIRSLTELDSVYPDWQLPCPPPGGLVGVQMYRGSGGIPDRKVITVRQLFGQTFLYPNTKPLRDWLDKVRSGSISMISSMDRKEVVEPEQVDVESSRLVYGHGKNWVGGTDTVAPQKESKPNKDSGK